MKKHVIHLESDRYIGVFKSKAEAMDWADGYFEDDPEYIVVSYDKIPKHIMEVMETVDGNGDLD